MGVVHKKPTTRRNHSPQVTSSTEVLVQHFVIGERKIADPNLEEKCELRVKWHDETLECWLHFLFHYSKLKLKCYERRVKRALTKQMCTSRNFQQLRNLSFMTVFARYKLAAHRCSENAIQIRKKTKSFKITVPDWG